MGSNEDSRETRSDDDAAHDHIGSQSATPSGARTPRPDLQDKRLPGIMHAYFQVGAESDSVPESQLSPITSPSASKSNGEAPHKYHHVGGLSTHTPPTAPSTPGRDNENRPPVEQLEGDSLARGDLHATPHCYPTPPVSSASSMTQKESDSGERSCSRERKHEERNQSPLRQATGNTLAARLSLSSARHTAGLESLPSVVTSSTVLASDMAPASNTRSSSSSSSNSPVHMQSPVSALSRCLESVKLTRGVAPASRKKNTPPHTPRSLSASTPADGVSKTSAPSSRSSNQTNDAGNSHHDESKRDSYIELPPTKTPRGKLSMKISEGRGLKPSFDPYVVCFFEWNEYITRGPKQVEEEAKRSASRPREDIFGGVPIQRTGSDFGRSIAIPMKSRQGSSTSMTESRPNKLGQHVTDPKWDIEATFDVLAEKPEVYLYVYDRSNQEAFLGLVRMTPDVSRDNGMVDDWFKLEPRNEQDESVTGEIHIKTHFQKAAKTKVEPADFDILKLIGKGTFGQVYQVRKRDTQRIYAMKVLSKKVIVQKKEVAHTLGERNILVRTAMAESPFIVGLKFSFQTETDLYFVTDFMSGGELFWHLQKEGRFGEKRAKFYIAELILALKHLHAHDIVYRDLKPENILLDANGHIALCDFGLSKMNLSKDDTTNTFCGTTEYLAPEVLLDEQGYTKMVDFWSLGVLVFEMCCGWSPFYAEDTQQMYKNIAFGKVRFPRDALSTEGRNFVKGLLNRNPKHRLGANGDAEELKNHPFFADIDWEDLHEKRVVPPFKPKLKSVLDTSNFDPEFTNALANSSSLTARAAALAGAQVPASTPLSPGMQANFKGFTFVDESTMDSMGDQFGNQDPGPEEYSRDDEGWDFQSSRKRDDRMSGIIKTSGDDNIFNDAGFEE